MDLTQDRAIEGRVSGVERHSPFFGRARALAEQYVEQRFVFGWVKLGDEEAARNPQAECLNQEVRKDRCVQVLNDLLPSNSAVEKSWGSNIVFFTPLQPFDEDDVMASLRRALTPPHYSRNQPVSSVARGLAAPAGQQPSQLLI